MINPNITVQDLNKLSKNTMVEYLGIEYIEVGADYIIGKMPVDNRTHQPMGFLHGGASVVLAETLGSIGSASCVNLEQFSPFGLEINANHVKSVRSGYVFGKASLIHFGKNTHIWDIRIENENKELVCISRLTVAIVPKK
ncbi:MAG: hotdog fold thioesterase [Sporocytophaga sp.]|uniref:hotdog fold thioesterase n=1 Tax=Sporocytophaga sp. TaxID=2231183 RepID=UPI001B169BAB|nr:hotdog fold thioesterase [Sporocytophaga sp.]MBO9702481.1 hotdog fold thioesterase [Sporocytophaga sp.]